MTEVKKIGTGNIGVPCSNVYNRHYGKKKKKKPNLESKITCHNRSLTSISSGQGTYPTIQRMQSRARK
jgi:hypothetical protein